MTNPIVRTARAGFTLVEVLVTLVLIALLVGVIVPSVISQLDRGEPARLAQDLEAVRSATKMFRVDVKRFPGAPEQLVLSPTLWDDSTDHGATAIPGALMDRWSGPYLETGSLNEGGASSADTLVVALGARTDVAFATAVWTGNTWLTLGVSDLTAAQAQQISEVIDGDTITTNDDTGGRVRWDGTKVQYYVVPIN